jgi:hypothetical protein
MRVIASILLAAVAIGPCDVSADDVNPFVPESIVEKQATSGAIRNLPINETTRQILLTASRQTGLRVYVFPGGQPIEGRNRTGSHRHDLGGAADLYLVHPMTRHVLDMRDPDDRVCMASFIQASVAAGATGVGAGVGYMGAHAMHVGGGSAAYWGGAGWVPAAYERGLAGLPVLPCSASTPSTKREQAEIAEYNAKMTGCPEEVVVAAYNAKMTGSA